MTLEQIMALGGKLTLFLAMFADCFGRRDARSLLRIYVQRAAIKPASQERRGNSFAVQDGAADAATLSRDDQVG